MPERLPKKSSDTNGLGGHLWTPPGVLSSPTKTSNSTTSGTLSTSQKNKIDIKAFYKKMTHSQGQNFSSQ